MNVYAYQAALYCEDCAGDRMLAMLARAAEEDSDDYPQGPYGNGGGEADCPQHCDACNAFLENALTTDGYRYVQEQLTEARTLRSFGKSAYPGSDHVLATWARFYDLDYLS